MSAFLVIGEDPANGLLLLKDPANHSLPRTQSGGTFCLQSVQADSAASGHLSAAFFFSTGEGADHFFANLHRTAVLWSVIGFSRITENRYHLSCHLC